MAIIDIRFVVTATVCMSLLVPLSAQAQKKVRQDENLKPSMACSSECGKKHGTGKVKGEAYNRDGYESCMVECMRGAKKTVRKENQK